MTATPGIPLGPPSPLGFLFAWTVLLSTETWEFTLALLGKNIRLLESRSVTLDSWNDLQVRQMKLGGNQAAAAALGVHIGGSPATAQKYSTRAASVYKADLLERAKADRVSDPSGANLSDIPKAPVIATPAIPQKSVAPLEEPSFSNFKSTSSLGAGKIGKLGAVKSGSIPAQPFQPPSETLPEAQDLQPIEKAEPTPSVQTTSPSNESFKKPISPPAQAQPQAAVPSRLGMGIRKSNGFTPQQASVAKLPCESREKPKAVSSEQYHRSDDVDPYSKERLRSFEGANAVSSAQFYGEENDDYDEEGSGN